MTKSKKLRLFHATAVENVDSILEQGLLSKWEGVYLTDSAESATRWMGFRFAAMGINKFAVIEVEVSRRGLVEGIDHSPIMHTLFGAGKSILSTKSIPPSAIKEVHYFGRA
jgi:RNA:NAD 2'-phosphotransferase (TPT1/KptA family)